MNTCGSEKPNVKIAALRSEQIDEVSNFALRHNHVVTYLEALLKDLYNNLPLYECVDYARDLETIRVRFLHEGLSFATQTLPKFFDAVLFALEHGKFDFPGFKLKPGVALPRFLYGITRQIFGDSTVPEKVNYFRHLYQFCVAFKKLEGPYSEEVLSEQLANFIKVDKELINFNAPQSVFSENILERATSVVTEVCASLEREIAAGWEGFRPRPGPGATNTPTEKHVRYRPHVLYQSLHNVFPYRKWFFHSPPPVQSGRWDLRVGKKPCISRLTESKEPTSRFEFVPKTYSKPRCICVEQLETQWLQQALRRALVQCIEKHPLTKGYVSFNDQRINAALALSSSIDRALATIDMSAASDRISRSLVERLFRNLPRLWEMLSACSTRVIELPSVGRRRCANLYTRKYAPMGSAVCFPVMGLVHFALIHSLGQFFSPPYVEIPKVYVYGDDIIVPHELALKVYAYLPLFGMKLNQEKSFTRSYFRESCGMNAFHGIDVTPTRFREIVSYPPCNQSLLSSLSYESALYYKGFKETAGLIRREILREPSFRAKSFKCVAPESGLLGWIREDVDAPALNYKRRWNNEFSRWEFSALTIVDVTEEPPRLNDDEGYLRSLLLDVQGEFARKTGGPSRGFNIRRKWVPGSAFYRNDQTRVEAWLSGKIRTWHVPIM